MLYGFPYTTDLWDWVAILYHQTDRVREDILATLRNWRVQYTENEIVNLCWGLTLSVRHMGNLEGKKQNNFPQ
jgi:hypothetical protein